MYGISVFLMISQLVCWHTVSALDCYRCGLTQEKLKRSQELEGHWPDDKTARSMGMVECGDPPEEEFVTSCGSAKKCHTIKWDDGQLKPIKFCFPVDQSCDILLPKLKGNPTCHECSGDKCNA